MGRARERSKTISTFRFFLIPSSGRYPQYDQQSTRSLRHRRATNLQWKNRRLPGVFFPPTKKKATTTNHKKSKKKIPLEVKQSGKFHRAKQYIYRLASPFMPRFSTVFHPRARGEWGDFFAVKNSIIKTNYDDIEKKVPF